MSPDSTLSEKEAAASGGEAGAPVLTVLGQGAARPAQHRRDTGS